MRIDPDDLLIPTKVLVPQHEIRFRGALEKNSHIYCSVCKVLCNIESGIADQFDNLRGGCNIEGVIG